MHRESFSLYFWYNQQLLARREGDVALVEQVIDVRRRAAPVRAIEALSIGGIPPGLDVTGLQMPRFVHSAVTLTPMSNDANRPLALNRVPRTARPVGKRRIPDEVGRIVNGDLFCSSGPSVLENSDNFVRVPIRLADEANEGVSKWQWHFSEIHGLQTIARFLKWRGLRRQERTQDCDVVLRSDRIVEGAIVNGHEPAFSRPVQTDLAEVRFRTGLCSPCHDADLLNSRVVEREHNVA